MKVIQSIAFCYLSLSFFLRVFSIIVCLARVHILVVDNFVCVSLCASLILLIETRAVCVRKGGGLTVCGHVSICCHQVLIVGRVAGMCKHKIDLSHAILVG